MGIESLTRKGIYVSLWVAAAFFVYAIIEWAAWEFFELRVPGDTDEILKFGGAWVLLAAAATFVDRTLHHT